MSAPLVRAEPDATIGILGGGQLGRMLALAAARLGFKCHVLCPEHGSPAFDVVRRVTEADYGDKAALDRFADDVDVITYEFENVPAETAAFLAARKPVLPDPQVLAITQDRLAEKDFIVSLDIATAPYAGVANEGELAAALAAVGMPSVLKTRRFGYDGKGQATLRAGDNPAAAWFKINDPIKQYDRIRKMVSEGFLVRTRADADTVQSRKNDVTQREKAFSSGAQFVSTDYARPDRRFSDYSVCFPGGHIARSNPVSGSPSWADLDLETGKPAQK